MGTSMDRDLQQADRDPVLTVDKNGQRHFSQMAWAL
jgi:hypothetical protein